MKTSTIKTSTIKNVGLALTILISIMSMSFSKAQTCVAAFTANTNGTNASFTNNSTTGLYYNWSFGDGGTSSQNNPSHNYASSGTYVVCLTAYDSVSCYASTCDTITVTGSTGSCTANFTFTVNGNSVSITNTSTVSANSWSSWTFGDGGSSWQTNPSHTYSTSGNYWICLSVYDSLSSCFDSICKQVTIAATTGGCVANFSYTTAGNNATFTNTSTGGTTMSWWFSFGGSGGTTSTQANPTITFPGSGSYTACLNIQDSLGTWCDSICKTVIIGTTGLQNNNDLTTEINSYPNPFNGTTTISYTLTKTSVVSISIYDLIGNEVTILKSNENENAGKQGVKWDASGLSNGIYLLAVRINENIYTQKLLLGNY